MSDNRPTADRPAEGRWLTYGDAAQLFGISTEALRSLARRNQWDRRSPNAVGGQSWVMIPADRLPTGGSEAGDRRLSTAEVRVRPTQRPVPTGGSEGTDRRSDPEAGRSTDWREDRRSEDILTAVREMAEIFMGPLRDQLTDLKTLLVTERERADRAEHRAEEAEYRAKEADQRAQTAENQMRDLQEQLTTEMVEHRRVVSMLTEQLATRRLWWPWRRRA